MQNDVTCPLCGYRVSILLGGFFENHHRNPGETCPAAGLTLDASLCGECYYARADAYDSLNSRIDLFKRTLECVTDERNAAIGLLKDFLIGPTMGADRFEEWKERGEAFLRDVEAAE